MLLVNLNGNWRMRRIGDTEWIPAVVPGSVYADLIRTGKMEDPYYRENEASATTVSDDDYEYTRSFSITEKDRAHDSILLRCEGLDTLCNIYLNGTPVLSADNMHRTYETDVRKVLISGENTIKVVFHSPIRFITKEHAKLPLDASGSTMHGFSHLRKAHFMFGWDWGPKLPDMGIWRSISLVGWDKARLSDVYITQKHQTGEAEVKIQVKAETFAVPVSLSVCAKITAPDGKSWKAETLLKDGTGVLLVKIQNPQLWWPNGMGAHPLYITSVTLLDRERELDEKHFRIGLRTLTVKTEPDAWGTSFAFSVNGVPFFAMGGNYIPEDCILSRVTPERTRKLLRSCADAHYNMVRVWGGGFYPGDFFYDACDEYGLVVWQDLAYACAAYRFSDEFCKSITAETSDNVRRIRHHACLGLWCGNNELESGWVGWGWSERFGPHRKADYIRQFEYVLPRLVNKLDPQTFYWHSSPSSGGDFDDPDSESRGDRHYWGVWHGLEPFTAYRDHFPRFLSEFGIQSFPCLKTIESFTLPEDRNIFSPVMEAHQKDSTANGKILHYISETYRYPKDFDSLLYTSQLIQAEGIRYAVEHLRRNQGRCMGALVWQINDCWPVASWSSIDYFGRWKALHYAEKRMFAPVLLSAEENGAKVDLHVSNSTLSNFSGTVIWRLLDGNSQIISFGTIPVKISKMSSALCGSLDFSQKLDSVIRRRSCYLHFSLREGKNTIGEGIVLFVKPKHYEFKNPGLSLRVEDEGNCFRIRIRAKHLAKAVELLPSEDIQFSDNFFDLAGGEERSVSMEKLPGMTAEQFAAGLKVRSLYDSYEKG